MTFWLLVSTLTLIACLAVLWPFLRSASPAAIIGHDVEVYRDQLAEIDRDSARGLVGEAEAQEARTEIARRLLRAAEAAPANSHTPGDRLGRIVATVAIILVPLGSWALYAAIGSPDLPDQRLAERLERSPAESSVDELIARAETHLNENPQDGRGWDVLAPIYMRVGRNEDAVIAYRNAIRLLGSSAGRESGLGEAIATAGGGTVNEDAREAFARALALEPANARARFYLALADAQEGKADAARRSWQSLLGDLPQGSPWSGAVEQALARLPGPANAGPTQQDVAAAEGMSQQDRGAMIEGMVAQLDQKLRANPVDPEGWQRLVRSYAVLGRRDAARDALARGIDALGSGTRDAAGLVAFAAGLGITTEVTR